MPTVFTQDTSTATTTSYAYNTGYNNIPINSNVLFNVLTQYDKITDRVTALSTKQDTLTVGTNLLGFGQNITSLNYNNITLNKPDLTPYVSSNYLNSSLLIYDKISDRQTAITALASTYVSSNVLTNYLTIYDKITDRQTAITGLSPTYVSSNVLNNYLLPYTNTTGMNTAISTALGSYTNTTGMNTPISTALGSYTNTTGMNTAISTALGSYTNTTGMNTAISTASTNTSNYVSTKFLPLIGGTLTNTLNGPTINATTNLQENGTNLSAKYLLQSGGILTGAITTNSTSGGNLITLNTSSTTATSAISFQNSTNNFGYVGLGCVAYPNNYASNLFLETTNDVIVNSGGFSATPKMIIKSSGNVGIGVLNPNCRLYISANLATSATVYAMRLSCGAATDGGGFGTLLGLGSEGNGWSKCAIGHTRTGNYDRGAIVFLTRDTADGADCTMADERMRITSTGTVNIVNTLQIAGNNNNNFLFNNTGRNHATYTDFNAIDKFGYTFIQGTAFGPNTGSAQYYSWYIGLGNEYPFANSVNGYYGMQFAVGRSEEYPKLSIRRKENNVWSLWQGLTSERAVSLTTGDKTISGILTVQHSSTSFNAAGGGLYVYNPNNTANSSSVLGVRIAGSTANKAGISLDVSGVGGWSIYANGNDTSEKWLRFNSSWDGSGSERLQIRGSDGYTNINGACYIANYTTIRPIVNDRGSYDHSQAPLTITNQTPTTATVLNDSLPVLNLCRQGTGGVAYGARATLCLSRFENVNVWSRTRLDFKLASDTYNDVLAMTLRSDGNTIFYPNPQYINNTNGANYTANLCVGCFTTGFATAPFISCTVADGWNGIDTITTITGNSGANSGYWNGSRIVLDGSYNTNAGSGNYSSRIFFQSQGTGGTWGNNAMFSTTSSGATIQSQFYFFGTVYYYNLTAITSDIITKKNIVKITNALDKIEKINGIEYTSILSDEKRVGVIAQDVEKVYPELVSTDSEGIKGVCYSSLIGLLFEGIKELNKNNKEMKDELNQMKEDMKQMKELLNQFTQKV